MHDPLNIAAATAAALGGAGLRGRVVASPPPVMSPPINGAVVVALISAAN